MPLLTLKYTTFMYLHTLFGFNWFKVWLVLTIINETTRTLITQNTTPEGTFHSKAISSFVPIWCGTISSQNYFVPEWATPFQAKISLSQNGLHHFRPKSVCPRMGYTISGRDLKQAGFLEVSITYCLHFSLLDNLFAHDTDILKRKRTSLAFCGSTGHWNKIPPLHRGHHRQLNK